MERRNFIKTGMLASSSILFIDSLLGCVNPLFKNNQLDNYFEGFQNPPVSSRLFVRWWWNGNRLDKKEILRELDVMKAAGIGGAEINPIAFPGDTDPVGYKALTIFDDEWLEMLQVALEGAKERGLVCDMIVGSGWPFGGEFLKKDERSQMVTIETIDLSGGKKYRFAVSELLEKVNPNVHSKNELVYKDLLMVRLLPKESDQFTEGTEFIGTIKEDTIEIDVTEGDHVLYYVVKLTGYMAVINGAPGAAGPVLNHYSKEATELYLDRISGFITSKIGNMGNYIRAMFCDSMELEGANWNDDLPAEFEKRRGYSLVPYLPFVLKKVGHMGNPLDEEYGIKFSEEVVDQIKRVDLDYYQTRIELFKERFIDTFNAWCHRNNVKSRMQAYGRGMHPVEASMEIDIPECETWAFKDVGREYPDTGLTGRGPRMCNKYVASGAALAGKTIVSCEEITNTAMAFMATLENIKIIGDQSNISGVNHSILHGFNYSPPEAIFPGWIRYGAYFNERNTWWPYFNKWSDYKARVSYIFQNAVPQANVAILQPLIDLWLKYGPQRDPFPQKCYPEYQHNLWEAINQNGGGCDVVSENIIKRSTFKDGQMIHNERCYSSILLPEIETLDIGTAKALVEFANVGGKIVFIEKVPFKSPSFTGGETEDADVKRIIGKLLDDKPANVVVYPAPDGNLISWYGKMQDSMQFNPYVKFDKTHKYLSQSNYRLGDSPVFFLANTGLAEDISVTAEFQVDDDLYPCVWNPETGGRSLFPTKGSRKTLELYLPRATSILLVFEKHSKGEKFYPMPSNLTGKEISVAWHLQLNHINGEKQLLDLDSLIDLTKDDRIRNFAGQVIYEKSINVDSLEFNCIDLGDVQGVSELTVNGKLIGTRWYGAHVYNIKEAIKEGENKVSIKLTTVVGNYMKGLKENKVAQNWTGYQEYYPMGIIGPVRLILENNS
ncbi:glycosyl hydrolase [Sunxiuqinia sp. A32]|uniref:glycosyl hydrolase n=1 Tax=Sunxiuqinia sp. A32 TaxID=3461496 RepID=UPI00404571E2